MEKVVVGVVIESENPGNYLDDSGKVWVEHERPEDAYVHPSSILDTFRENYWEVQKWVAWPHRVYPAIWKEGEGTTIFHDHAFDFTW